MNNRMTIVHVQDGFSALHLAAQHGRADVVRVITEALAHVDIKTKVKCTFCKQYTNQHTE